MPSTEVTMTSKRTETGSYVGRCIDCRTKVVSDDRFRHAACGGAIVGSTPIKARVTAHVCGPKCTSALGAVCDCTCGGKNHGADHR